MLFGVNGSVYGETQEMAGIEEKVNMKQMGQSHIAEELVSLFREE